MKTWQQILNEVGLVPPEQTMRDQEDLIAQIGECEFCKEYLEAAQALDPVRVEGLTWQNIMDQRMSFRAARRRDLGLYEPADQPSDSEDEEEFCYALVQFRDNTVSWCEIDINIDYAIDDIECGQLVRARITRTGKISIGTIIKVLCCTKEHAPLPEEYLDCIEDVIVELPQENMLFNTLYDNLKFGFSEYEKNHPGKLPHGFTKALFKNLDAFGEGEEIDPFSFSAGFQSDYGSTYVDVQIEESLVSASQGGSTYDPAVGSDSYTNWLYTIWNNGCEDGGGLSVESLDCIGEFLADPDIDFSIECPDEFFYSSSNDDEDNDELE